MKRFQGFIGKTVNHAVAQGEDALSSLGVEGR